MTLNPSSPVTGSSLPFTIELNSIKKIIIIPLKWDFPVDFTAFQCAKPFFSIDSVPKYPDLFFYLISNHLLAHLHEVSGKILFYRE
jgi:hypothetical protein